MIANLDLLPFAWMSDSWNVMDLLIVIISLVSLTPTLGSNGGVKAIRVMRAFRVARIFKRLIALRLIVKALADSLIPVMNTFFVMLVSTSVFAILGVALFSDRPVASHFFGHFSEAFFTMFQARLNNFLLPL